MNSVAYLPQSKRLLDQVREVLRYKHYSLKTEQAYLYWVRFFVRWHGRNGLMQRDDSHHLAGVYAHSPVCTARSVAVLVIKAYLEANGQGQRNICLIPSSAHGTNPASAQMAGMKVVVTACDAEGNVDMADLQAKCEQHSANLACVMINLSAKELASTESAGCKAASRGR